MAVVISTSQHNQTQQHRGQVSPENRAQAVLPAQIWDLLTPAQQQQVLRVMSQVGRSLVQNEVQEQPHEAR